jgi:hypothetical protein
LKSPLGVSRSAGLITPKVDQDHIVRRGAADAERDVRGRALHNRRQHQTA